MALQSLIALRHSLVVPSLLALCSCGSSPAGWSTPGGGENGTGQVTLAIASVPANVQCVQITASGSSTVTHAFAVSPGAGSTGPLSLGELPLGSVSFTGQAYGVGCGSIAAQPPSWIADPQTVNLQAGVVASLTLTFRPDNPVSGSTSFVGNVAQVAPGYGETDVVLGDGTVEASGQVAGNLYDSSSFGLVGGLSNVVQIAPFSLGITDCALLANGTVECWGNGQSGQLGNGTTSASSPPGPVSKLMGVAQICGGAAHACALTTTGSVACWGGNSNGQLGNGSTTSSSTPVFLHVLGLTSLTCGDSFACAIDSVSGRPMCWGSNSNGQLGNGSTTDSHSAGFVTSLVDLTQIAAAGSHTCALRADGTVFCWGGNGSGEVGDGTVVDRSSPVQVSLTGVQQIAVNASHSCARKSDGSVWCWGDGQFLGTGTGTTSSTPVRIHGMPSSTAISMGGSDTCSIGTDLSVDCWGDNSFGQLGTGSFASSFVPAPLKL